jgi:hypothetical protein
MTSHLNKWLDPYDDTTCDQCGERKETVRPRKTITVGLKSGVLRWKFCEECAANLQPTRHCAAQCWRNEIAETRHFL